MKFLTLALFLVASPLLFAQTPPPAATDAPAVLTDFNWSRADVASFTAPPFSGGQIFPLGAGFTLGYHASEPVSVTLRTVGSLTAAKITTGHYAITGKIKFHDLPAGSYLEMVSTFAPEKPGDPEGIFYSRTLADSGPSAKLTGTSDGREFLLAADSADPTKKPVRLALNIYLTGEAQIEMSDVKLVQYPDAVTATSTASAHQTVVILHTSPTNQTLYAADGLNYPDAPALQSGLKSIYQATPQATIALQADDTVPTLDVASAVDAIDSAGFRSPTITIQPTSTAVKSVDTGSATEPETAAAPASGIDAKSFMLGVAATIFVVALISAFSFFLPRATKEKSE
jgi:biopolymer transport protein ExbD